MRIKEQETRLNLHEHDDDDDDNVSGGTTILRENAPEIKLHRYNQKYLCFKLQGYGDNGEIRFKDLSHEAFAKTEFNKIFSGRQPRQGREDIIKVLKNYNYYIFID